MNLSEEQYELIEAYLADELSPADRLTFERDFQADKALWAEVERQAELRMALRGIGIARSIEQARRQYQQQSVSDVKFPARNTNQPFLDVSRPLWSQLAVAASVAVLLTVGYYVYRSTATTSTDVAMATTQTADATDELLKSFPTESVPPTTRNQFLDALTKYKAGHYEQVITQLKTMPADKKTVYYRNYFLGLSYLANRQAAQAIPLFRQAGGSPSVSLRRKAEWFLALAYVKNAQPEQAHPLLERISEDKTNTFRSLAQQVLKKIS